MGTSSRRPESNSRASIEYLIKLIKASELIRSVGRIEFQAGGLPLLRLQRNREGQAGQDRAPMSQMREGIQRLVLDDYRIKKGEL